MTSKSTHGRNEPGHASYENLKIEVKFDHNPSHGLAQSNQNVRKQDIGASLGTHKRREPSFQPKSTHNTTYASSHQRPSEKVLDRNIFTIAE